MEKKLEKFKPASNWIASLVADYIKRGAKVVSVKEKKVTLAREGKLVEIDDCGRVDWKV